MAQLFIPTLYRNQTGGQQSFTLSGSTVGEVLAQLEALHPGISQLLLRPNLAISVDDEVTPLGLLEAIQPDSEIHFIAAISGGEGSLL